MSEPELTPDNVREALGLGSKREAPKPTEPEADDHVVSDHHVVVDEQQTPAATAPVATDTGEQDPAPDRWLAPGIPRAPTPAEQAASDRQFFETLYRPNTDDAA